jgi:hypothetical protein
MKPCTSSDSLVRAFQYAIHKEWIGARHHIGEIRRVMLGMTDEQRWTKLSGRTPTSRRTIGLKLAFESLPESDSQSAP